MPELVHHSLIVPESGAGRRLDQVLAELLPDYSRSHLKGLIEAGQVRVNAQTVKPRAQLAGGETVELWAEPRPEVVWTAQALPLNIVYADDDLIVIDKPAGLVVHPGAGQPDGTLVNALLNYDPQLECLPRAGIVHRLDKDTSGLLVVARSQRAHTHLVRQLQKRTVKRGYEAVVHGVLVAGGTVDAPIGRHRTERTRMAVTDSGKPAVTHYRVIKRYTAHTHIRAHLETGRTHQIRVHLAHLDHPLVGDPVYSRRRFAGLKFSAELTAALSKFKRQALHAAHLAFVHPADKRPLEFSSALPDDFVNLLSALTAELKGIENTGSR